MIKLLRKDIPIRYLCEHFSVSRSGFYHWLKSDKTSKASIKKDEVLSRIKNAFKLSKKTYGSPRIYRSLKNDGINVCQNTVAKYMKELKLNANYKKKFKVQTTDSNHSGSIADRVFKPEEKDSLPNKPGETYVGDITYIKTTEGFLYLAIVLDLYNREVVGWSMRDNMEKEIVLDALRVAIENSNSDAQITFHSDRGSQYASKAYKDFLSEKNVIPSMSRKGNCYDNCYAESWFASLKKDCIYRHKNLTQESARSLVFEYIEVWYNKKRMHSSLGYLSPKMYKELDNCA